MTTLLKHRLVWPVAILLVLLISNVFFTPSFFSVAMKNGHLYGSIIDILRAGAPLIIVGIGMTVVIATGGIDLSVGAVVALSGSIAVSQVSKLGDQNSVTGVLMACAVALAISMLCGLWNGVLVAVLGIQPIIATLILMVGGRGLAQLVSDGQIVTIVSSPYKLIGGGYWLTLPFSILVAAAIVVLSAVISRRTAFGLLLESVGGNAEASRLAGIRSRSIVLMAYVFSGLCGGIAGLMISSNVSSADANNMGLWYELDAILAVVIGGTALIGGRYLLAGTVAGALVIQTLTTTIYTIGIPPETTLLFKAFVVTVVCLLQSAAFRAKVFRRPTRPKSGSRPMSAAPTAPAEPNPQVNA